MSDLRSLSLSSGDEGRVGPFRGEEDMDYLEFAPSRMVAEGWSRANASPLDAATRIVRQDAFVERSPRTGGGRIGLGPAYYCRLSDEHLVEHMQMVQTELTHRYGSPESSGDDEWQQASDDSKSTIES